jgi:nucleoside-diphosphate-sugar epimerase
MVRGDVRDAAAVDQAVRGVDVVFHTAALAGIWGPRVIFEGVNVQGTLNVLHACKQRGVGRLVYTSSPSVTFDGRDQCGVDESAPYAAKWLCDYPRTKALAEQAVLSENSESGLKTCALRPHLIWGPGDPHLVPRLMARARAGRLRRVGKGRNRVDVIYVDNAARAHLLAAERLVAGSPVCGRAYFLSQGEPVNLWEWVDELLELAGLPKVRKHVSARMAWRAGAALERVYRMLRIRREPPMTRFLAVQLSTSHYFDISRARSELGYSPAVSTREGMRRLAESWH